MQPESEKYAALLKRYQDLNFRVVYWTRKGTDPKAWKGPTEKGWNDPARAYPLERYDPATMNLGLITGTEVAPGKFLADVDLDWPEGLPLAGKLLPSTGFAFGRKGKKLSHAIFTTPEPVQWIKYFDFADDVKGTGEGTCFVELRGGNFTHQSMIAPSLHSKDVRIELVLNGEILHVTARELRESVLDYAIGCLILKRVPGGLHHDGRVALTGFLLRAGLSEERVVAIQENVCGVQSAMRVPDMSSKDVADVRLVVRTTLKRIEGGKKIEGGPKFAEFIGGNVGKFVVDKLNNWLGRDDDYARDNDGKIIKDNQRNIKRALTLLNYELSYQEFSEKALIRNGTGDARPLDDRTMNTLWLKIDREQRFRPTFQFFEKVVTDVAYEKSFHPIRDYLVDLKWDGEPRINTWLSTYGGAKDLDAVSEGDDKVTYLEAVSAIVLIAAVRRVFHPGCKYDEMLVLESPQQGLNKSSALRALCPRDEWFSDDLPLNVEAKEVIERTLGKWIIEAQELTGRKADQDHLKAMLSRQIDGPARMAYAHLPVERPRQFIIIGTTNNNEYLMDSTGARRFWPVRVGRFDTDGIIRDRDMLWAEAVHREAAGESIRLHEELWESAKVHQEARREVDAWEETLEAFLDGVEVKMGMQRVSASSLWNALGINLVERRDRMAQRRISEIMQRFGFERTTVREDGEPERGYVGPASQRVLRAMNVRPKNTELSDSIDDALSPIDRERLRRMRNEQNASKM